MSNRAEMIGSSKTLVLTIERLRYALGTRGPWKTSIGLRGYHDELIRRLAKKRYRDRF